MGKKRHVTMQSATTLSNAVRRAEGGLRQPGENEARVIDLRPADIETRTELFQPRMLTHSGREVDAKHVKKLMKRMATKGGELRPVVVVNIDSRWVCVDGHHRLAAYMERKHEGTIKANWFAGTVREAVAESRSLNQEDELEMSLQDNYAAAWQQTVLDWGGPTEVMQMNNVSRRLATFMKEVREAYHRKDEIGSRMRGALGMHLGDNSWRAAREAYLGLKGSPERTLQDKAATLSKQLTNKMTDFLSRDPEVTAHALKMYDRELIPLLVRHLQELLPTIGGDDDDDALELPMVPRAAIREMSDKQLRESLDENQDARAYLHRKRMEMEREQDRRAGPGTPLEPLEGLELTDGTPEA